jgi:HEAT repeat protein
MSDRERKKRPEGKGDNEMKRLLGMTAPAMICASLIIAANGQTPTYEDRAKTMLADALEAKNPDTRKEGVKALRIVAGQEPFASQLEAMLRDSDVQVRVAAIEAEAELKNERGIAALKTALNDQAAEVRFVAAKALLKLNDPAGREFLIGVLNGDMKVFSGMVAAHVRETKRTVETPNLLIMNAVKLGVPLAPVPYLGIGYSSAQAIIAHRGISERAATALLLGKDQDSEVVAALRNALTDKNASVRAAAVQSLGLIADTATKQNAAALFVPLFNDKNQAVRLRAAASYLRLENMSSSTDADEE